LEVIRFLVKSLFFFLFLGLVHCASDLPKKKKLFPGRFFLRNSSSPLRVILHPNLGNFISQIDFRGREVLYSPRYSGSLQVGENLEGIPFLFPFANRIERDSIPIASGEWTIPQNAPYFRDKNGLPMHGFLSYWEGWEVQLIRNGVLQSSYESSFQFGDKEKAWFPFELGLEMDITLEENELIFSVQVQNRSAEPMPLSLGFHPYFWVPEEVKPLSKVFTNARKYYQSNEKLLPTGNILPIGKLLGSGLVSSLNLDHTLIDFAGSPMVVLEMPDLRIRLDLLEGFDSFHLFTPKDKDFVCIEPMLGPVNSFFGGGRSKRSPVNLLPPGGTWKGLWKLSITSLQEF
jgi:aldose 1-epimerase